MESKSILYIHNILENLRIYVEDNNPWWSDVYYFIINIKTNIDIKIFSLLLKYQCYFNPKYHFFRAQCYSLDDTILTFILPRLREFVNMSKNGYPIDLIDPSANCRVINQESYSELSDNLYAERWQAILEKMLFAFELKNLIENSPKKVEPILIKFGFNESAYYEYMDAISSNSSIFDEDGIYLNKYLAYKNEINRFYEIYNEGFSYFSKYFNDLWD